MTEVADDVIDKTDDQTIDDKPEVPAFSRETFEQTQKEQAAAKGWEDYEAFVEKGGDPAKWRSAEAFNLYGEMVGELKRTRQDFDSRLEGVHNLAQAQLKVQREQLLAERDALIEEGGRTKEVGVIEKKIDALNIPQPVQRSAILDQWNAANPWILEDSPKSTRAYAVYDRAMKSGQTIEQAIQAVETDIAKHFPKTTPNRPAHIPESEKGKGSKGFGGGGGAKTATMDTLTEEERAIWKHSASMWKNDQKSFLQSVNDRRSVDKGAK